ncbi:Flp pilus assembly protein CpaB [Novosphingobium rosa]|uniref:Flp pilus assembly protein CpaB n=1 Tax=Novosphingobium rosa TaxID=76978 RepID=UPI000A02ACB0|nr:Flp pilus assembly protein CpaB [Novosphingobium rosa]
MDKKKVMIMLGLGLVAVVTALAAMSMLKGSPAPQVQAALPVIVVPKGPRVLVAQRSLQPGTIITNDAINFQEWPKDMVNGAYFVDGKTDMNKLLGTVVRFPITAGQPLTTGALVAPGDRGFLAAALGPGMRAVTITVSEKSGVAGFVFPGDHVDLMLTTAVKIPQTQNQGPAADTRDLYATETILKNLRVLATDQSTEQETNNGKTIVHTFHTATLEVTPKIAEKIEVAQQGGALSLVLRSLADNQSDLDHAIANGSVKLPEGATKADEARALASAGNNGPASAAGSRATLMGGRLSEGRSNDGAAIQPGSTFATAGDVSRFQRRALPSGGGSVRALASGPQVRVMRGSDTKDVDIGSGSGGRSPMSANAAQGMPPAPAANPVN